MDIYVRKRGGQSSSATVMTFVFGLAVGFMLCYLLLGVLGESEEPTQQTAEAPAEPPSQAIVDLADPDETEPMIPPAEDTAPEMEPVTLPADETSAEDPSAEPADEGPPELDVAPETPTTPTAPATGEDELSEAEIQQALSDMDAVEDLWPARHLFITVRGPKLDPATADFLKELKPGGVVLLGANVQNRAQTIRLVADIKRAVGLGDGIADLPLIAADQEGGSVNRLKLKEAPSAESIGKRNDTDYATKVGRDFATACTARGIGVMFAPVLDVFEPGASSSLRSRSFGTAADLVTAMGLAFSDGVMKGGVIPVVKHYPGHGATRQESSQALPITEKDIDGLRTIMLPFAQAIERDIPGLMVGHIAVPTIDQEHPTRPASISPVMTGAMLREQLKYKGVIVTDDIATSSLSKQFPPEQSVVQALNAGCDAVIFIDPDHDKIRALCAAIEKAVEDGALPAQRLRDSKARLDQWSAWLRKPAGLNGELPQAPDQTEETEVLTPAEDSPDEPIPANAEMIEHTVVSGDNLSKIALQYGVEVIDIQAWNEMNDDRIRLNQKLIIYKAGAPTPATPVDETSVEEPAKEEVPAPAAEEAKEDPPVPTEEAPVVESTDDVSPAPAEEPAADAAAQDPAQPANTRLIMHTIQPEENLSGIGRQYSVSAADIKTWNGLPDDMIKAGFKIKIYVPEDAPTPAAPAETTPEEADVPESADSTPAAAEETPEPAADAEFYTVVSGDTPSGIAQKLNTTTEALMELNGLDDARNLKVDQKLKIPK